MRKYIVLDADFISAFIKGETEKEVIDHLKTKIFIPREVYYEVSRVKYLKEKIDFYIALSYIEIFDMEFDSKHHQFYLMLQDESIDDGKEIGRGEAAAIAIAYIENAIIASNNLKDVSKYVDSIKSRI